MDILKLVFVFSIFVFIQTAPQEAQAQRGKTFVDTLRMRWRGQLPPKTANPRKVPIDTLDIPDSLGAYQEEEYDIMSGPDSTEAPPPKPFTTAELQARFAPYEVKTIDDPKLVGLTEEQILNNIAEIDKIKPDADRAHTWAIAYYAADEELEKIEAVNYGLRRSKALYINTLQIARENSATNIHQKLGGMKLADIFDIDSKAFVDPEFIEKAKQDAFATRKPYTIKTHSVGLLMPNAKEFGLEPKQGASGYRYSIDEDYNLLIVKLGKDGTKAIIWYSTPVWGSSRIVAVL
ncbi:MAG: hypothetical protein AAF740_05995 [Bacteroidota bacterium]